MVEYFIFSYTSVSTSFTVFPEIVVYKTGIEEEIGTETEKTGRKKGIEAAAVVPSPGLAWAAPGIDPEIGTI